jgi:hypothetical protein
MASTPLPTPKLKLLQLTLETPRRFLSTKKQIYELNVAPIDGKPNHWFGFAPDDLLDFPRDALLSLVGKVEGLEESIHVKKQSVTLGYNSPGMRYTFVGDNCMYAVNLLLTFFLYFTLTI